MSEEILALPVNSRRIVRYPLFVNSAETPHRLYPLVDIGFQILNLAALIICLEMFALITSLPAGSETGLIAVIMIPFVVIFGRFFLRNARVTVSDQGISFPTLMAPKLDGRLFRPWADLETVELHEGKDKLNFIRGNVLTMIFKSGGRVDLDTTRIPRDDLRVLEESLLQWTESGVLSPAVSELVSRNDLEISDSPMFVFAKKRRTLLSDSFGLTNHNLFRKGDAILGGDYIVEKILASAGGHCSYLVTDTHGARNVCLTEYDLAMLDVNARERISAELTAASEHYKNLQIPYLLNLIDTRVSDDKFYTIMEPGGQTLRAHVEKYGALSEQRVYALALKLAEAVDKLHDKNSDLYMGGIKPDAIMYKPDGTMSITEFGFVDDLIMASSQLILVDAPYAAPERIAGRPVAASDLYSIGATIYFALTRLDPEAYTASRACAVNPRVSLALSNVIGKLLSSDPSQRGTVSELIHELGGVSIAKIGADHV